MNEEKITALDDEQRVKVLSPGMLVVKRFFRNRLAMAGLVILITMFVFSYIGGMLTPYGEAEVFRKKESILQDHAVLSLNSDFLYTAAEGKEFPSVAGARMILAISQGNTTFSEKDVTYTLVQEGKDLYRIEQLFPVATVVSIKGNPSFTPSEGKDVSEAVQQEYRAAMEGGADQFTAEGVNYVILKGGKQNTISVLDTVALAGKKIFDPSPGVTLSLSFKLAAEKAFAEGASSFTVDGEKYTIEAGEYAASILSGGEEYAVMSDYAVRPVEHTQLSLDFIRTVQTAVLGGESAFGYVGQDGKETNYVIEQKGKEYRIRSEQVTLLNDTFAAPGRTHWMGTENNGMDMLTRLMYGGRISLLIGFAAIAIEMLIGVLIGGVAGYFGKWADTVLMRVSEIVTCIPTLPVYIIIGSIMDYYRVDPRLRMYLLCLMLGALSWPGIARMVRGQILSFREQEFMLAAEATGIRVSRRILKHLIPNVIPNLIVVATMGLGEIILMEATLSFLGIGVKFPFASWGNILNSVNNIYVMTNYWYAWIPAGFLILFTVLGFNFVGDGLRDAFDPKMKR